MFTNEVVEAARGTVTKQSLCAIRMREAIFTVLGKQCAACGAKEKLAFDVIVPNEQTESHHGKMSWSQRLRLYCRQLSAGNLQVLCSSCNSKKQDGTDRFIEPLAFARQQPF